MAYEDSGHRPHADHRGEHPRGRTTRGPESLRVTLDTWGPVHNLFPTMHDQLQSNWGERPSRSALNPCPCGKPEGWEHETGWCRLSHRERERVMAAFTGKTLPQVLESLSFMFLVDGCTRASTHQLVRTRVGAAYMQHGGRDNDWRHRDWTMPETIYRAILDVDGRAAGTWEVSPVVDRVPIEDYIEERRVSLEAALENYLDEGRKLYAALVDSGVPWQDARRVLWIGTQTYIHINYNYAAMRGVLANRLEHIMDWEINCVAQLMVREVRMKCPYLFSIDLQSHSSRAGKEMFGGLESWPPTGPWPYTGPQLPRTHRPEQNPFWVMHPDSLAGHALIGWVPTNGTYPSDFPPLAECPILVNPATE